MEIDLYTAIKKKLVTTFGDRIKTIELWNNQFRHANNANLRDERPFSYPCVFIEFAPANFLDQQLGVQQLSMDVILHIGFETMKTESFDILTLKQEIHYAIQHLPAGTFALLTRTRQEQDFDHNNVQEYKITYSTWGTDASTSTAPTKEVQAELSLSETLVPSITAFTGTY